MSFSLRRGWMVVQAVVLMTCLSGTLRADLRIMPLGDSNTVGFHETPNGSYRYFLEQYLVSHNIAYDFVGSQNNGSAVLADTNHEGHAGWRTEQLATLNIAQYSPDVVLLLAGTNNWGDAPNYALYKSRYDTLFNAIGNVPVVVSTVPKVGPNAFNNLSITAINSINNQRYPLMNQVLYDIQAERSNVTVVDFYAVMNPAIHLVADDIHFNTAGHQLLANLFIQGMSVAVPEPSQVLMMLIPVTGLIVGKRKRIWSALRRS